MQENRFIEFEDHDSIGVMSMDNRPHNYISRPDFIDIPAMKEWITAKQLKGIIITGKGNHFSAGADVKELKRLSSDPDSLLSGMRKGKEALAFIESLEVPVIAAIKGACFGGGLEIALAAHIRVAAETAMFAFPESGLGIIPGMGGTVRLPLLAGRGAAVEMILRGDIISAERARELKIVDYLAPKKEVMDFSVSLMKKMVEKRPLEVINAVMRSVRNAATMDFDSAMEEESRLFCRLAVKQINREKTE